MSELSPECTGFLPEVAARLARREDQIAAAADDVVQWIIEQGQDLFYVKQQIQRANRARPSGTPRLRLGDWIRGNFHPCFGDSLSTATRYMQAASLAERHQIAGKGLSRSMLYLLARPSNDTDTVAALLASTPIPNVESAATILQSAKKQAKQLAAQAEQEYLEAYDAATPEVQDYAALKQVHRAGVLRLLTRFEQELPDEFDAIVRTGAFTFAGPENTNKRPVPVEKATEEIAKQSFASYKREGAIVGWMADAPAPILDDQIRIRSVQTVRDDSKNRNVHLVTLELNNDAQYRALLAIQRQLRRIIIK